jgi:hypothetical protein
MGIALQCKGISFQISTKHPTISSSWHRAEGIWLRSWAVKLAFALIELKGGPLTGCNLQSLWAGWLQFAKSFGAKFSAKNSSLD